MHREVAKALPKWKGKTVIDAMNALVPLDAMNALVPLEELDGLPSSAFVAKSFTGAKFVKGFSHLVAATLAADPNRVLVVARQKDDPMAALDDRIGRQGGRRQVIECFHELGAGECLRDEGGGQKPV